MGGSMSCCPDESIMQRVVLVMKEDGESLKFKEGTPVKDVLAAHPFHKIIRCSSERPVVPSSSQLSCNWLYFLLPEGLALSDATYQSLLKSAVSKKLMSNEVVKKVVDDKTTTTTTTTKNSKLVSGDQNGEVLGKVVSFEDYGFGYKWKPVLKPIPEIASPAIHTNVQV